MASGPFPRPLIATCMKHQGVALLAQHRHWPRNSSPPDPHRQPQNLPVLALLDAAVHAHTQYRSCGRRRLVKTAGGPNTAAWLWVGLLPYVRRGPRAAAQHMPERLAGAQPAVSWPGHEHRVCTYAFVDGSQHVWPAAIVAVGGPRKRSAVRSDRPIPEAPNTQYCT